MSFTMFVTWVLVGVLAGVLAGLLMKHGGYGLKKDITFGLVGSIGGSWIFRAVGIFPGAGIVAMAFVAFIGAAILIVAQRKLLATEHPADEKGAMWRWGFGAVLAAVLGWMILGPAPQPVAIAAVVEDKFYTVTPAAVKVKAGIVTGEVMNMKVTERIEQGSGRVVNTAKLTGTIMLKNGSTNQTVRLVAGKIQYIDVNGQPIKLEDAQREAIVKFSGSDRLDPGQEATESLDVDFPAVALKAKKLKEIRFELTYVPSPYKAETANLPVEISVAK